MLQAQDETPHYRAIMHEQDAVLIAPTGERIATFVHFEDAAHAAEAINTAADNADTLGRVASTLERWLAEDQLPSRHTARRLLMTVNTAPARHVIKAGTRTGIRSARVRLLAKAGQGAN